MDPVSAFLVACWFAWLIVRDGAPLIPEARGQVPHTANNRHAERMQRMQHAHEKWMARHADRRSLRENPSLLRQAVDERLAGWARNAGRRQEQVADGRRAAETQDVNAGRTAGTWRTAWRDAREYTAAWWKHMAERAEQRFSTRPPVMTEIHTDDDPQQQAAPDADPAAEQQPTAGAGEPPTAEAKADNEPPPKPKYATSVRLDEPKALEAAPEPDVVDAEVVDEPDAAPCEAEEPPSNVIPINRGERHMSDSQVLTLGSGETINPETGIAFADGLIPIYAEMGSRIQASIANLSGAGVAQDQIAKLTEMLNLNSAAIAKAEEMKQHFVDHQGAAALVGATGAGTNNGYLGNH